MNNCNTYLPVLIKLLHKSGEIENRTFEGLSPGSKIEEIGLSSLSVIILISDYMNEVSEGKIELNPKWISYLNNIEGICSILKEIDDANKATT